MTAERAQDEAVKSFSLAYYFLLCSRRDVGAVPGATDETAKKSRLPFSQRVPTIGLNAAALDAHEKLEVPFTTETLGAAVTDWLRDCTGIDYVEFDAQEAVQWLQEFSLVYEDPETGHLRVPGLADATRLMEERIRAELNKDTIHQESGLIP